MGEVGGHAALDASAVHVGPPNVMSAAANAAAQQEQTASDPPSGRAGSDLAVAEAVPVAASMEAAGNGTTGVVPSAANPPPGLPPRSKGGAGKGGARRGRPPKGASAQPVEQVALPANVEMVRIRYEPKSTDPTDDLSVVTMSQVHKASQLQLSDDRLTVTGHKGYRSARASHGVYTGTWYCEAKVEHLGDTGHVRVGWGTKKAELQAPVGFDSYGFGYRDVDGSKVHVGKREVYGDGFKEGDVVGLFIHLPEAGRSLELETRQYARYKGKWMKVEEEEPKPQLLPGSVIAFTLNGVLQPSAASATGCGGVATTTTSAEPSVAAVSETAAEQSVGVAEVADQAPPLGTAASAAPTAVLGAFVDFNDGTYFPIASVYTMPEQTDGASVCMNFGPNFAYAPPPPGAIAGVTTPARALCLRAAEVIAAASMPVPTGPLTVAKATAAASPAAAANDAAPLGVSGPVSVSAVKQAEAGTEAAVGVVKREGGPVLAMEQPVVSAVKDETQL